MVSFPQKLKHDYVIKKTVALVIKLTIRPLGISKYASWSGMKIHPDPF